MTSPADRLSLGPSSRGVRAPLHDDLEVGNRGVRRRVGGELRRLELLEVPTAPARTSLRRTATTARARRAVPEEEDRHRGGRRSLRRHRDRRRVGHRILRRRNGPGVRRSSVAPPDRRASARTGGAAGARTHGRRRRPGGGGMGRPEFERGGPGGGGMGRPDELMGGCTGEQAVNRAAASVVAARVSGGAARVGAAGGGGGRGGRRGRGERGARRRGAVRARCRRRRHRDLAGGPTRSRGAGGRGRRRPWAALAGSAGDETGTCPGAPGGGGRRGPGRQGPVGLVVGGPVRRRRAPWWPGPASARRAPRAGRRDEGPRCRPCGGPGRPGRPRSRTSGS